MKFDTLKLYSHMLRSNRDNIAYSWVENRYAKERLVARNIDTKFFANHFGVRVIDYAIGVIEGSNELGNCPIIHVLLEFFKKKNISLNDLFIICSSLKNTVLLFAVESGIASGAFVEEFTAMMDANFEGVMIEYMKNNKFQNESYEIKINISVKNDAVTSASEFVKYAKVKYADIEELKDLEDDTLELLNCSSVNLAKIEELTEIFDKYADILSDILEFHEIYKSIATLSNIIKETNFDEMHEKELASFCLFCRSLVTDLGGWRYAIFVAQSQSDIHWLDDSLIAQMAQLEVILTHGSHTKTDELELEIF